MAWQAALRILLHNDEVGTLRSTQAEAVQALLEGRSTGQLQLASNFMPRFPECVLHLGQDRSLMPIVLATLSGMRAARCTPQEAALVQERNTLVPLQRYKDYDQMADFTSALTGSQTICIRPRASQPDGLDYVNSRGKAIPIVVPATPSIIKRLATAFSGSHNVGGGGGIAMGPSPPVGGRHSKAGALAAATAASSFSWQALGDSARKLHGLYQRGYAFPEWAIEKLASGALEECLRSAIVYHAASENPDLVKLLATQREPCNIEMRRLYKEGQLESLFGFRHGAYERSTSSQLMPNIAAYCRTPLRIGTQEVIAHVINSVGYAFDSKLQPDYKYFFPMTDLKWRELTDRMKYLWRFIFACAKRHNLQNVFLCNVGGGFFARLLNERPETHWSRLREQSLPAVQAEYPSIRVNELYSLSSGDGKVFLDRLVGDAKSRLGDSLLVNAWDPWSLVGNGNLSDDSLDGRFGRCSAMAVICSPLTNPFLKYEPV